MSRCFTEVDEHSCGNENSGTVLTRYTCVIISTTHSTVMTLNGAGLITDDDGGVSSAYQVEYGEQQEEIVEGFLNSLSTSNVVKIFSQIYLFGNSI